MEKITKMTTEPIIGKFYLVPCSFINKRVWMPIIPLWHEDADIGIHAQHFHYDVRFMPKSLLHSDSRFPPEVATMGAIATAPANYFGEVYYSSGLWKWMRRKCLRSMPQMPKLNASRSSFLENKYVGRKVLCGKCPHKGFNLLSLPKDSEGNVICNGHGLKASLRDGVVVKRVEQVCTERK